MDTAPRFLSDNPCGAPGRGKMQTYKFVPLGIIHTTTYDADREKLMRRVEDGVCHQGWEIEL